MTTESLLMDHSFRTEHKSLYSNDLGHDDRQFVIQMLYSPTSPGGVVASNSPQGHDSSLDVQPSAQQTGFSAERPRKRQKIALACDTCRARKVKCDGLRPCGLCARRKDKGVGCAYNRDKDKTTGPNGQTDYIPFKERQGPRSPSMLSSSRDGSLLTPLTYRRTSQQNAIDTSGSPAIPENISSPGGPQAEKSRGIDSMTGVVGDESASQEFFGSSSAGSFMRQIKSAIDVKIGLPPKRAPESGPSKSSLFQMSPPTQRIGGLEENVDYVLPSRKTADNLMDVYWTLVHPLYPFLNRQMFEDAYESIWSGSSPNTDERMLMCTMNVIFALGCQLSQSIRPERREAQAKVYFKRAQDLLRLDLWDIGSTELIQCLLLMGQYLQSTNNPHQCWMVVGHVVRVAQSLGFHLPESSFGLQSPLERELARRIWHGCIMMDRVLSMTFGRPAMISKSLSDEVPLPAMIDDEFLGREADGVDTQPEGRPPMMAFYIKSLHLYSIINDILLALYMGHEDTAKKDNHNSLSPKTGSSNIARVIQLDQALMTWGQTLPPHLRLSSLESAQNSTLYRQAVVCRARFLHARMLLFRPILSQFCLPQSNPTDIGTAIDESLAERMVLQCSTLCLRTAHDMIDLIYANLDLQELRGPLPAWWYSVLYIYTAATVLLAARLRPAIATGVSEYSIADSWAHAIEILKAFQRLGQSAQRCVAALEILSAKVSVDAYPVEVNSDPNTEFQHATTDMASATSLHDIPFDDYQVGLNFSGITFDLNDMSWLTSLPGNL